MNFRWTVFLSLVAFSLLGWFYQLKHSNQNDLNLSATENNRPNYVGYEMKTVIYSKEGRKAYEAEAKQVRYFNNQHRAEFEAPQVFMFDVENENLNKKDWQLSAQTATLDNLETLHLNEKVQVKNLATNLPLNTFNTEAATYHLSSGDFTANSPTTVSGSPFHSESLQFSGNLKRKKLTLENQVKTHYEIKPR